MAGDAVSNGVSGSGEHTNVLPGVASTSLTEATPGSSVVAPGRVHPSDVRNVINPTPNTNADAQAVTDAASVGGAHDVANVGGVLIAPATRGNPPAQIQVGVGVVANALGALVGAPNAGAVPAAHALAPALAQRYFNIEAGLSGPPLRRSEVGPFF